MVTKFAPYLDGNLQNWVSATYPTPFSQNVYDYSRPMGQRQIGLVQGEWRANTPFQETFYFHDWTKGRSAVNVYWKDSRGKTYPMFMKDFEPLMLEGRINGDGTGPVSVSGTWQIVKRGANYGIQRIGD